MMWQVGFKTGPSPLESKSGKRLRELAHSTYHDAPHTVKNCSFENCSSRHYADHRILLRGAVPSRTHLLEAPQRNHNKVTLLLVRKGAARGARVTEHSGSGLVLDEAFVAAVFEDLKVVGGEAGELHGRRRVAAALQAVAIDGDERIARHLTLPVPAQARPSASGCCCC
jgi:hypothetical protein